MSMVGELKYFLGLQVAQDKDGTRIHQQKYVKEILKKFGMDSAKPCATPMSPNDYLTKDESSLPVDPTLYRGMIGSLLYLTASRPDILFSVCLCARFQADPRESHVKAVKRILRYLKGTDNLCLFYPKGGDLRLVAYTDADYAGCKTDRKSTSGMTQFLGPCLISWGSKKQSSIALSMKGRVVIPEMTIDREFLAQFQLVEVSDTLIAQGWDHLFREEVLVDDDRVREFYSKFKLEELRGMPLATFVVGGVEQVFSCRELGDLLGVPARGYEEYNKGIWPESVAKGDVIRRVGGDPNNVSHQGKANTLNLINRILHKLICTSITPKTQKHDVLNFQDFLLLDKLQAKAQIHL
ncbi:unnamed protein product [Rhodiola kirilowii]